MKRIVQVLLLFTVLTFFFCLIYSFTEARIPALLVQAVFKYRLYKTWLLFFNYIPAVLCCGFLISLTVVFGRSPEGSLIRFSGNMFVRYKTVVTSALVIVTILTVITQVFQPLITRNKRWLEYQPHLFEEYLSLGEQSLTQKKPSLAYLYAMRAVDIDTGNEQARTLLRRAELLQEEKQKKELPSVGSYHDDQQPEMGRSVYELLNKSEKAARDHKWFDAHYYAQLAVQMSSLKSINLIAAKEAAAEAWNKLSTQETIGDKTGEVFFSEKKRGYTAFMDGNILQAYYIFTALSNQSKANAEDPDIKRYLSLVKQKMQNRFFFIDETYTLQRFENIHNMYFSLKRNDRSVLVVLIRGVTDIKSEGNLVRYLRGVSVYSFDAEGRYINSFTVPYAKLLAEPVTFFSEKTRKDEGISLSYKYIPYMLLRSVAREEREEGTGPAYRSATGDTSKIGSDTFLLPMPYDDFNLIATGFSGPEQMNLFSLFHFVSKASLYGFPGEIYEQVLLERILYPFAVLILLVFLASVSWDYRVLQNQVFKFKWIFVLPFFVFVMYFLLGCIKYLFRIMSLVLVGILSSQLVFLFALVIYILLFIFASFLFLSRKI